MGRGKYATPKERHKEQRGRSQTTKTSPAHLPIQSDRKPTKESLGCLRHNGRYSPPLKEMLIFSADGHIQKVTHCSPPSFFIFFFVCETTVSHSQRDSHQSQLATVVWVLLDLGVEKGVDGTFFGDLRPIIGAFTFSLPAGKPIE